MMETKDLIYCVTNKNAFDNLQDALEFVYEKQSDDGWVVDGLVIDVCKKITPTHKWFFGAENIIDDMQNSACDQFSEYADDYLNDVEYDKEKMSELDSLISDWFNKNAEQPRFWKAGESVDSIVVNEELFKKHGLNWGGGVMGFEEWKAKQEQMHNDYDAENAWNAGVASRQAEIDALQKRIDELEAKREGFVLVPIDPTDEIAEAIAFSANVCGGIAYDVYKAVLLAVEVRND